MVYINEWFPNPTGPDASGEFIELYNSANGTVNVTGWTLKTENGKKFLLKDENIPPGGYLVLKHADTKLSLRNASGGLALYGPAGSLVDYGNFSGPAPQGKSFSRIDYGTADIGHFAFVDPTPGAPNKTINNAIAVRNYPTNVALNHRLETSEFFAIMMGTAVLMLGLIIYVITSHEDLSKLLFGRDEATGRASR